MRSGKMDAFRIEISDEVISHLTGMYFAVNMRLPALLLRAIS